MSSVSDIVTDVVSSDPIIQQCIGRGIVNYSKLAKMLHPIISQLLGKEVSVDSIKMALIRYSSKAGRERQVRREVLEVLARSSIEIRTDITIVTLRSSALSYVIAFLSKLMSEARFIAIMQSVKTITIVLDRETANEYLTIIKSDDVINVQKDQAAIIIVSPIEIVTTPGVLAYIANVLAQNNINITHIESCYTDTIIILSKNDVEKAFSIIMKHIDSARKRLEKGV
ncbi:ACT domain-containing protein [Ignisphaera sp. 4213-co]|uniref:ACT domain-containing protein n=1 Tax=Ignisphaera cupida TaxID=3050454 RepID=A0ABD4Z826_9CREN|nr:ACT domain-containing protein [Ignisphaera sp. 4213-co]MDK6029157.1 ACT domain-containing protein [Ignisphaera sp. 4213-co]